MSHQRRTLESAASFLRKLRHKQQHSTHQSCTQARRCGSGLSSAAVEPGPLASQMGRDYVVNVLTVSCTTGSGHGVVYPLPTSYALPSPCIPPSSTRGLLLLCPFRSSTRVGRLQLNAYSKFTSSTVLMPRWSRQLPAGSKYSPRSASTSTPLIRTCLCIRTRELSLEGL